MKNINKGLGYLAVAAIAIAILYFTKEAVWAVGATAIGFWALDESD